MERDGKVSYLSKLYGISYVISLVGLSLASWLYWDLWPLDNPIPLMADIVTLSLGLALLITLSWEALRAMVLFAPQVKERFIAQGREQGRAELREKLRKDIAPYVVRKPDGSVTINLPPDVADLLLNGESPDKN